jgi:hypothetical protein
MLLQQYLTPEVVRAAIDKAATPKAPDAAPVVAAANPAEPGFGDLADAQS